ncbi:MAG: enoyl-CoA hydratase/isomerase family protein [Actinobacteria bacterium]|nr:enoyl-CoA hydratase/isomerase family protein [Actinomycetota bacterium]MCA1722312.1 enoyl-CoA hydratase/isomerase family protein [Actinomycetota bacterium]
MSGPLRVERPDDGIVVLTLDLPDVRNAMTGELTQAWGDAVAALRGDRSVRCVVVTGAGRAFCAGGDLGWLAAEPDATPDQLRDRMLPFYTTWLSLRALDVPSIAAVNGAAVGAGAALALSCDIRYAGAAAKVTVPFAQLGMHAGMATTWLLPEVVGAAAARELLLTGRVADATEMLRLGMCSAVYDDDVLMDRTLEHAAQIASGAPVAQRLHKLSLADGGHASFEAALQWEAVVQPVTLATADLQEGLRAKVEKRKAVFTGR